MVSDISGWAIAVMSRPGSSSALAKLPSRRATPTWWAAITSGSEGDHWDHGALSGT
jgi:hypothetical protein